MLPALKRGKFNGYFLAREAQQQRCEQAGGRMRLRDLTEKMHSEQYNGFYLVAQYSGDVKIIAAESVLELHPLHSRLWRSARNACLDLGPLPE